MSETVRLSGDVNGDGCSEVTDYLRFLNELRRNSTSSTILSSSIRTVQEQVSDSNSFYSHGWFVDHSHIEYDGILSSGGFGGLTGLHPVTHNGALSGVWAGFYRIASESATSFTWQNCAVEAFCNRALPDEDAPRLHQSIVSLNTSHVFQGTSTTVAAVVKAWRAPTSPSDDLWHTFG